MTTGRRRQGRHRGRAVPRHGRARVRRRPRCRRRRGGSRSSASPSRTRCSRWASSRSPRPSGTASSRTRSWPWAQGQRSGRQADGPQQRPTASSSRRSRRSGPTSSSGRTRGCSAPTTRSCRRSRRRSPAAKGSTDYFSPWDQQTELIAKALGKERRGPRARPAGIKDQYAKAAAEHPEFEGKTITFSQNGFYAGSIYVYPDGSEHGVPDLPRLHDQPEDHGAGREARASRSASRPSSSACSTPT